MVSLVKKITFPQNHSLDTHLQCHYVDEVCEVPSKSVQKWPNDAGMRCDKTSAKHILEKTTIIVYIQWAVENRACFPTLLSKYWYMCVIEMMCETFHDLCILCGEITKLGFVENNFCVKKPKKATQTMWPLSLSGWYTDYTHQIMSLMGARTAGSQ